MACQSVRSETTSRAESGSITELLRKIVQNQREAEINNRLTSCENCMINIPYNTKPIAIYMCNGERFTTDFPGGTSNTFRVEEVRGETVLLRLIANINEELICTNFTCVLKISCICCVQCFDPIHCSVGCSAV